jgi:decaprenylphospho-beta-D-erythro-pentofuranosid-2-ulose 2-reductase
MKRILIIGATSAIAEHCARIWAARGDALHLVARNDQHVQTIASDLTVRGASAVTTYSLDLNDVDKHEELLNVTYDVLGSVDIVLIAHGTLSNQKSCELSVHQTLTEIQTNALSTISLLTLIANKFEESKSGTICVISSVAGDRGRASNYVYGSAKAMVTAFASGLRQRLHKSNVSVVTIKPGFVDTPMTSEFKKGFLWAKPTVIASQILRAIDKKKSDVYVPKFWWTIMTIINVIPSQIFRKLNL